MSQETITDARSHRDCEHEGTPAARAQCRKERLAAQAVRSAEARIAELEERVAQQERTIDRAAARNGALQLDLETVRNQLARASRELNEAWLAKDRAIDDRDKAQAVADSLRDLIKKMRGRIEELEKHKRDSDATMHRANGLLFAQDAAIRVSTVVLDGLLLEQGRGTPRLVATAEELDELKPGSVVRRNGQVYIKKANAAGTVWKSTEWKSTDGHYSSSHMLAAAGERFTIEVLHAAP
jgi:uncharacterized coiled-coil protein SlyX